MRAARLFTVADGLGGQLGQMIENATIGNLTEMLACLRQCSHGTWTPDQAVRAVWARRSTAASDCARAGSPIADDRPHRNVPTFARASASWPPEQGRTSVSRSIRTAAQAPITRSKPTAASTAAEMRARDLARYRSHRPDRCWRFRCPCARANRRTMALALPKPVFPGKSGHSKAPWTIRQDHPGGKDPATGPTMQPSTANTQHDRGSPVPAVPPELLETSPGPLRRRSSRRPASANRRARAAPDFLTAAQLAARLGVSRETVRRLPSPARCRTPWSAAAPGRPPAGTRGGSPTISRPAAWTQPTWPPSPPSGGRGSTAPAR